MKIYVDFEIPATLKEFLTLFFSYDNGYQCKSVKTYYDEACVDLQCEENKYRSFDDLFDIVNTYYDVSEKELVQELIDLIIIKNDTKHYVYFSNCSDIKRITVFYYNRLNHRLYEPGEYSNQYNSKYHWFELLTMIGINNKDEYLTYLDKLKQPVHENQP